MLRKLIKNKKAQNTAEYAILISLVVAGIIAMQTYAQRALQARVRDASRFLQSTVAQSCAMLGNQVQYEPYYLTTNYEVLRDEDTAQILTGSRSAMTVDTTRSRMGGGFQESSYNTTQFGFEIF